MRLIALLFLLMMPPPALAQDETPYDDGTFKDSVYFTMDDGVMSPEEMVEEAEYVHKRCANHYYQKRYFNCECIAGAFLREREQRGPMVLQETILSDIYRGGGDVAKCANTATIAGNTYKECMTYAAISRRLENNNEEYCQCAANRVARDFTSYPYLRTAYIERLNVNALLSCEQEYPSLHWP